MRSVATLVVAPRSVVGGATMSTAVASSASAVLGSSESVPLGTSTEARTAWLRSRAASGASAAMVAWKVSATEAPVFTRPSAEVVAALQLTVRVASSKVPPCPTTMSVRRPSSASVTSTLVSAGPVPAPKAMVYSRRSSGSTFSPLRSTTDLVAKASSGKKTVTSVASSRAAVAGSSVRAVRPLASVSEAWLL